MSKSKGKSNKASSKEKSESSVGNIHSGHRQRMKEKYERNGIGAFADHEKLELLLYFTNKQKDTNPIAHKLIKEFGNLKKVLEADREYLEQIDGVGKETSFLINLIYQLCLHLNENIHEYESVSRLSDINTAGSFCCKYFEHKTKESLIAILLNTQKEIIKICPISEGTVDRTAIYAREIVELALKHKASAVILAHNHPGNNVQPSNDDVEATDKIDRVLSDMDITLVDHFICAGKNYVSMRARGLYIKSDFF